MKKFQFKPLIPHIIAVVIFIIVAVAYCKPALEGKVLSQHDIQGWRGMSQQSVEFHDKYGTYPLWTNSMFAGMPAYQIAYDARTRLQVGYLDSVFTLGLPKPISFFFLACLAFYFLCLVAGADPWVAIMGAIAYSYSTFDPIIVAVGHNTQMESLGYAPAVLAGLLLLFKRRYIFGFALTALFSALLIGQSHLQIVYYTLMIAGIMTVAYLVQCYKEKNLPVGLKAAGLGLLAGVMGLACNAVTMMPTYEYAKESMRGGKSELTLNNDKVIKTKGGLDKDYAFRWSYDIPETFTLIVPGIYGGSNGGREFTSSKFADKLTEAGSSEDGSLSMANYYSYWGDQPFTSGPVYLGAVICFLFIFGLVYIKGWQKWWIIAACIIGILMAWGGNFKAFNYFLFDHLPFYNKFRAPSMSLVIPQLCFPLLGVLAVTKLVRELDWTIAWKKLKLSGMITGVVLLVLVGFYFSAGFSGTNDKKIGDDIKERMLSGASHNQQPSAEMQTQAEQFSKELVSALRTDRKELMGGDLLKTIILIGLAFGFLTLFVKRKVVQPLLLIGGLIILSSFDLLSVDKRYLNENNFEEESSFEEAFTPTDADVQIMKDPDHANFRVFNTTVDAFNDAITSFHHNSIGGYHPAKLGLYQDIIEHQLSKNNINVFNMLNTKYFIQQSPATGKPVAVPNPNAYGNVWLVKGIKWVDNSNSEMQALDSTNLKDTAVIQKQYASVVKASQPDSSASIKLTENRNDVLKYDYQSATPQFAVFSEVYYNKGWNAYLDGQKSNYVKSDYALRGMSLPSGQHKIEFRFEPSSVTTGRTITIISNIIIILVLIASIVLYLKGRENERVDAHLL